jgi:hypothetical protein
MFPLCISLLCALGLIMTCICSARMCEGDWNEFVNYDYVNRRNYFQIYSRNQCSICCNEECSKWPELHTLMQWMFKCFRLNFRFIASVINNSNSSNNLMFSVHIAMKTWMTFWRHHNLGLIKSFRFETQQRIIWLNWKCRMSLRCTE